MATLMKSYTLGQLVRTTVGKIVGNWFVYRGTQGVVVGSRLVGERHYYYVSIANRELLLVGEEIESAETKSTESEKSINTQSADYDSELCVSALDLVTYCRECDRYFDIRVGCPCDVAFTLRSTLESNGVDCNTALLAQETLLSIISGVHIDTL